MRALVTGGAGFIGRNLCKRLVSRGYDVVALDNLERSQEPILGRGVTFLHGDVLEPLTIGAPQFDVVYHLACPAGPQNACEVMPLRTLEVSYQGTLNMLRYAKACGARFVLASTSEVYGDPLEHPQAETYFGNVDTQHPRAVYAEGKRVAETLVAAFARDGLNAAIVRFFNVYGPGMPNDGCAVPTFVWRAIANKTIEVFGRGGHTRCYCFVKDAVEAMARLSDASHTGVFNVGNPVDEISALELAKLVRDLAHSQSVVKLVGEGPVQLGEPSRRCPDITKTSRALAWRPLISLADGLRATIDVTRAAVQTSVVV